MTRDLRDAADRIAASVSPPPLDVIRARAQRRRLRTLAAAGTAVAVAAAAGAIGVAVSGGPRETLIPDRRPSTSVSPPSTGLVPADSTYPAAGVCEPLPGDVATIEIGPDTPRPRCAVVTAPQRLRVVNATNGFNQPGETITVRFADFAPRTLGVGAATTFDRPFGDYLAVGVHDVHLSNGMDPEIVLRPASSPAAADVAACRAADLRAQLFAGGMSTGSDFASIAIWNPGAATCRLAGDVGFTATFANGTPDTQAVINRPPTALAVDLPGHATAPNRDKGLNEGPYVVAGLMGAERDDPTQPDGTCRSQDEGTPATLRLTVGSTTINVKNYDAGAPDFKSVYGCRGSILLEDVTGGTGTTPAPLPPTVAVAECRAGDLLGTVEKTVHAAGTITYLLALTNRGTHACQITAAPTQLRATSKVGANITISLPMNSGPFSTPHPSGAATTGQAEHLYLYTLDGSCPTPLREYPAVELRLRDGWVTVVAEHPGGTISICPANTSIAPPAGPTARM